MLEMQYLLTSYFLLSLLLAYKYYNNSHTWRHIVYGGTGSYRFSFVGKFQNNIKEVSLIWQQYCFIHDFDIIMLLPLK